MTSSEKQTIKAERERECWSSIKITMSAWKDTETVRSIEDPGSLECKDCHLEFPSHDYLQFHIYAHHKEKRDWIICDWNVAAGCLRSHEMVGRGCNKYIKNRTLWERHMLEKHYEIKKACPECKKEISPSNLSKHLREQHCSEEAWSHQCNLVGCSVKGQICGKIYRNSSSFWSHQQERKTVCLGDGCDKTFKTRGEMKNHLEKIHLLPRKK